MDPVPTLAMPVKITFDSVFDLTIDQLKEELIKLGHDAKGWTKSAMQKCLCTILTDKTSIEEISQVQFKLKQLELEQRKEERLAEERRLAAAAEERRLVDAAEERRLADAAEERRLAAEMKKEERLAACRKKWTKENVGRGKREGEESL